MMINELNKCSKGLVICNNQYKQKLIEYYSSNKELKSIIFKTPSEVARDLLGEYDKKARIILAKEQNILIEEAEIKLSNSLLINNQKFTSKKLLELFAIKIKYNDYLIKNPLALNLYKGRQIIIINNFYQDDRFKLAYSMLQELNNNIKELTTYLPANTKLDVFEFSNYKEEILSLLKEIAKLLDEGVDPGLIKIEMPVEYYNYANEVFNLANIELNIKDFKLLSNYEITKNIIKDLEGLQDYKQREAFEIILEKYQEKNNQIMDRIITIFNSYMKEDYTIFDIYPDLVYTFNHTSYIQSLEGGIRVCNVLEEVFSDADYIFIVGLNQDVFPKTFKDEEYLLDYERAELGLLTSYEKNKITIEKLKRIFGGSLNLYLSYPIVSLARTLTISSFIHSLEDEIEITIIKKVDDFKLSYSKKIDEMKLGKCLDLYYKFDIISEELFTLNNEYKLSAYKGYDNTFKGIDRKYLNSYLNNRLSFSYTSIDKYNKCGFLFYLENVLKIKRSTNEDSTFIGNLIHYILYNVLNLRVSSDLKKYMQEVAIKYYQIENKTFGAKDEFFLNKYIDALIYLLEFIKEHEQLSEFKIYGLEKEFEVSLGLHQNIVLKGKIDKILTAEFNNTKYAIVVDYKTGDNDFDLNLIAYGLNMQIMFYFYFLNQNNNNYNFAGGYLQSVLPNSLFSYSNDKTYIEQFKEYFQLSGYSNSNINILRKIDKEIEISSKFIKGIRFSKNGFYASTLKRVFDDEVFRKLLNYTNTKITESINNIQKGEFQINPKLIGKGFDSCKYCAYKDLCFRDSSNYKEYKEYTQFEFLEEKNDSN